MQHETVESADSKCFIAVMTVKLWHTVSAFCFSIFFMIYTDLFFFEKKIYTEI
jgi:hypothetical protein